MISPTLTASPVIKPLSVEECDILMSAGVDLGSYELIDGRLEQKMPKGLLHIFVVARLAKLLRAAFGETPERVLTEASLRISPDTLPEPDLMVLALSLGAIVERGDGIMPADVLLVVEVADSSLDYDLRVKASLYAKAGIVEYWVVDLNRRFVYVHQHPLPESGVFRTVTVCREIDQLQFTGCIAVSDLFATRDDVAS